MKKQLPLAVLAALSVSPPIFGQERPATEPPVTATNPDEVLKQLLSPARPQIVPLNPEPNPVDPNASNTFKKMTASGGQQSNLVREGTYIHKPLAQLTYTPENQPQLTFDPDPSGIKDPPMLILPNQVLAIMEQYLRNNSKDLKFTITGMVTEYNNANYILLAEVIPAQDQAIAPGDHQQKKPKPDDHPKTQPSPRPTNPDDVLKQLLSPARPQVAPLTPGSTLPGPNSATFSNRTVAPGGEQQNLVREGTIIHERVARLNRTSENQPELTFDSDGMALKDPPMLILPNLQLTIMEQQIKKASKDLKFRITGTVTEYNSRNYILLDKVVVVPDETVPPNNRQQKSQNKDPLSQ